MGYGRGSTLLTIAYLAIGVIIAADHHYFQHLHQIKQVAEAVGGDRLALGGGRREYAVLTRSRGMRGPISSAVHHRRDWLSGCA